ncbi:MAG: hypothetical protein JST26_04900 [Bacteroidetes bacterium]|nr:hypothetical protein [Bacteroidota bacterium]
MFTSENDNINYSECIGTELIECSDAEIKDLTPPAEATRALLQFFTNEAGILSIGTSKLAYTPIAVLTESGQSPEQGFTGRVGIKLFHMAIYEVRGLKNLAQTRFLPFTNGYTCLCSIQYFK